MTWSPAVPYHNASVAQTPVLVKGQQLELDSVDFLSLNTADCFLHLYDAATAAEVTIGTTVPKQIYLCQGGDGSLYTAFSREFSYGLLFSKGLVIAVTDEYNVSNAPATPCKVDLSYR